MTRESCSIVIKRTASESTASPMHTECIHPRLYILMYTLFDGGGGGGWGRRYSRRFLFINTIVTHHHQASSKTSDDKGNITIKIRYVPTPSTICASTHENCIVIVLLCVVYTASLCLARCDFIITVVLNVKNRGAKKQNSQFKEVLWWSGGLTR